VLCQLQQIYQDLDLELVYPIAYPALQDLPVQADETFVNCYRLFQETEKRDVLLADEEVSCVSL
jgi:hypothetical protein